MNAEFTNSLNKVRKTLPKTKLLVNIPREKGGAGFPTQWCPETLKRECYSGNCTSVAGCPQR